MIAAELHGWGKDADFYMLKPQWTVDLTDTHVSMAEADYLIECDAVDLDKVERYAALYRTAGADALPPVVGVADLSGVVRDDLLITGLHRLVAAAHAGLRTLPMHVVRMPVPQGGMRA